MTDSWSSPVILDHLDSAHETTASPDITDNLDGSFGVIWEHDNDTIWCRTVHSDLTLSDTILVLTDADHPRGYDASGDDGHYWYDSFSTPYSLNGNLDLGFLYTTNPSGSDQYVCFARFKDWRHAVSTAPISVTSVTTGKPNVYNSMNFSVVDSDQSCQLNYPYQRSMASLSTGAGSEQTLIFYSKRYNSTDYALGYKTTINNGVSFSAFKPLLFIAASNYHRSKYDVLYNVGNNASVGWQGIQVVALGDADVGQAAEGSQKVYFFLGRPVQSSILHFTMV